MSFRDSRLGYIRGSVPLPVIHTSECHNNHDTMFSSLFDGLVYSFSEEHKQYYLAEINKLQLNTEERIMVIEYLENLESRRYSYNNLPEPTKEIIEELCSLFKASRYVDEFQLYGFLALWCLNKTRKTSMRLRNHAAVTREILATLETYPERFVQTTPDLSLEKVCGWHYFLHNYTKVFKSAKKSSEICESASPLLWCLEDCFNNSHIPEIVKTYWMKRVFKERALKIASQLPEDNDFDTWSPI